LVERIDGSSGHFWPIGGEMVRLLSLVIIVLLANASNAADLPDLLCLVEEQTTVHHIPSLAVSPGESRDTLVVKDGSLYIDPIDRDKYLYGELRDTDLFTYATGFKTLIFDGPQYKNATAVHVDRYGTRVRRMRCVQTD
jgi:hypothetical protein